MSSSFSVSVSRADIVGWRFVVTGYMGRRFAQKARVFFPPPPSPPSPLHFGFPPPPFPTSFGVPEFHSFHSTSLGDFFYFVVSSFLEIFLLPFSCGKLQNCDFFSTVPSHPYSPLFSRLSLVDKTKHPVFDSGYKYTILSFRVCADAWMLRVHCSNYILRLS